MVVVSESEVRSDPAILTQQWEGHSTFALVSGHDGPSARGLNAALDLIPAEYQTGHFALMTSGSTGQPKVIVGLKLRAERLAEAIHSAQDAEPASETIVCLPVSYSYAFVNQWVWAHHLRRRLLLTSGLSRPDEFRDVLNGATEAMVCLVGSQVPFLVGLYPGHQFPGVIRLNFAGGRFPQEHLAALRELFPNARVSNNYGCAEAMPRLTVRRAEDATDAADVGWPLPGVEMRASVDDRLEFRSPYRAVAYIEGQVFRPIPDDVWVETGDLGRSSTNGAWTLLGRHNEVFKRFGEKVSLPQIQTAVQHVWDGEIAFYREIDSLGENAHVMMVAPRPTREQLRLILAELRQNFSRPHWPLRIEGLDILPKLPNGKPDVVALAGAAGADMLWRQGY